MKNDNAQPNIALLSAPQVLQALAPLATYQGNTAGKASSLLTVRLAHCPDRPACTLSELLIAALHGGREQQALSLTRQVAHLNAGEQAELEALNRSQFRQDVSTGQAEVTLGCLQRRAPQWREEQFSILEAVEDRCSQAVEAGDTQLVVVLADASYRLEATAGRLPGSDDCARLYRVDPAETRLVGCIRPLREVGMRVLGEGLQAPDVPHLANAIRYLWINRHLTTSRLESTGLDLRPLQALDRANLVPRIEGDTANDTVTLQLDAQGTFRARYCQAGAAVPEEEHLRVVTFTFKCGVRPERLLNFVQTHLYEFERLHEGHLMYREGQAVVGALDHRACEARDRIVEALARFHKDESNFYEILSADQLLCFDELLQFTDEAGVIEHVESCLLDGFVSDSDDDSVEAGWYCCVREAIADCLLSWRWAVNGNG